MQGIILQIPFLLAVLISIFIVGYSTAKYNHIVHDDEITAMKATVDKGILHMVRPIKNLILAICKLILCTKLS